MNKLDLVNNIKDLNENALKNYGKIEHTNGYKNLCRVFVPVVKINTTTDMNMYKESFIGTLILKRVNNTFPATAMEVSINNEMGNRTQLVCGYVFGHCSHKWNDDRIPEHNYFDNTVRIAHAVVNGIEYGGLDIMQYDCADDVILKPHISICKYSGNLKPIMYYTWGNDNRIENEEIYNSIQIVEDEHMYQHTRNKIRFNNKVVITDDALEVKLEVERELDMLEMEVL